MTTLIEKQIAAVYVFYNGMVMTFDQHGKQMPYYQGPKEEALPKILAAGYMGRIEEIEWPL